MLNNFLLTYSVQAQGNLDSNKDTASNVRDEIARLNCWDKLDEVETTFTGKIDVSGSSDSERKKSAIRAVEEQFQPFLKKHHASSRNVKIFCAMMLDNVDIPFDFTIENKL